jgi:cytochrome c556
MLRILSAVAIVAVGTSAVYAQSAAIAQRKDAFKAMAGAAKEPSAMIKGDAKFELPKVQAALKTYQEQAGKLKTLFPDDSKTGGETAALPVIWEKKAAFTGIFDKLAADAKTAEGAIKDEASFKAEWPKVMSNCGTCHQDYRMKK